VVLAPTTGPSTAGVGYPADGSVVTAGGLSLGAPCSDTRPASGNAQVVGISLFGGVVTAGSASVDLSGGGSSVSGLRVGGVPTTLVPGHPIRLGYWGYLLAPDPTASSRSAMEIELRQDHAGLEAGTILFIPYARIEIAPTPTEPTETETEPQTTPPPAPATTQPRATSTPTPTTTEAAPSPPPPPAPPVGGAPSPGGEGQAVGGELPGPPGHQPLTVTPPLGAASYVFPVAGPAAFGDSYGGVRSDVRSGWHHGDDIFAPLGTPVVAVADGTLNRVGWERLGGWRLWVRDRAGDEFYYAHLSGYTPLALRGGRVHRGEVIGFVGNTGDAFTTLPHLHFEVHPRQLLTLRYDGAVDPTSYLMGWRRPGTLRAAHPVLPPLPHGVFLRSEALTNFRELLAARGLDRPAAPSAAALAAAFGAPPMVVGLPRIAAVAPTAAVRRSTSSGPWVTAGAEAALVALGVALAAVLWRRRRPA
jgi:murein DD-endopeptidase MepM/ murein hydrolase activator NlpD